MMATAKVPAIRYAAVGSCLAVVFLLAAALGGCASPRTISLAAEVSKAGGATTDAGRDLAADVAALRDVERIHDRKILMITLPERSNMWTAIDGQGPRKDVTASFGQLDDAFKAMKLAYQRYGLLADPAIVGSTEQAAANLLAAAEEIDKLPPLLTQGLPSLVGIIMANAQERRLKEHNVVLAAIDSRLSEVLHRAVPVLQAMANDAYKRMSDQIRTIDLATLDEQRVKTLVKDPHHGYVLKRLYLLDQFDALETSHAAVSKKIRGLGGAFDALAKAHKALAEDEPNIMDVLAQLERVRALLGK